MGVLLLDHVLYREFEAKRDCFLKVTHSKSGGQHSQAGPEAELLAAPPQHIHRNQGRGKGNTHETYEVLAWGSLLCVDPRDRIRNND